MKIVRLFSFIILTGAYLSADSNIPAPIPIDFGVNNGIRSDCESCDQEYEADEMGASCCDEATQFDPDYTCEVLEETYLWNCSGCTCAEDDNDWTTNFGCIDDEEACNYNAEAEWNYCIYAEENYDCDGNCTAGEDCNGECGGIAEVDACGVCAGGNSSCADCAGVPNGDSWESDCGCVPEGNLGDDCDDCAGVPNGDAELDACGVCNGDNSTCVTVTDIDGNVYGTVQIGDQLWTTENLKVTRYNDGSEILNITNNEEWSNLPTGAYVNYDNNPSNSETYGRLYNWYTVDDERGVCPDGYHVPADAEYTVLTDYLGGEHVAGGKLKEAGLDHWNSPNTGATNESGFTGLPAGSRYNNGGNYYSMDYYGFFWSSSPDSSNDNAWCRLLDYSDSDVNRTSSFPKEAGFSIRCLLSTVYGCMDTDACNYNLDATEDDGSCLEDDCAGECGGSAVEDACGVCDGDSSSCADCEGVPYGDSWESDCGCVASDNDGNDCDDCFGAPNGSAWNSDCGCVPEGSSGDDCDDCAGVPNGDNVVDNCDTCDNDPENDCVPDCSGEWGGEAVEDECGVCGGSGILEGACDCFGSVEDNCGVCGGDNTSCSWTELSAEVEALNNISLRWDAVDGSRAGRDSRECDAAVCLSIENVDIEAGTLDIYMINTEVVGGWQFELLGITVASATAPNGFMSQTSPTTILAFSLSGATVSPSEGVLTQVSFTDFGGTDICFGTNPANNVISDPIGNELYTEWGKCSCSADNPADECGECGGPGIADDACDCDGNLPDIECGEGTALEGQLVCFESECAGISYNVYRDGQYLTSSGEATEYIDMNLGYSESHCYTVTEVSIEGESDHSDEACATTNEMPDTPGCIFETACNYNPNAVINDGSCWFPDLGCECINGQNAEADNCGVCDTDPTNDCTPDCNGDWGGSATIDNCGVCDSDSSNDNLCNDCNGDPFGNAVYDKCGEECIAIAEDPLSECSAYCDSDYTNDCVQDCNGIWGGDALEDMCGTCDNDTSNDCVQDCADVWGGTGEIDLFGVCCTETEDNECIMNGCDLPDSTLYLTETSMAFNSSKAIKQILLTLEGSIIPSSPLGGVASDAGFVWLGFSNSSNWVLGKNQSAGTSIPAGSCGNLVNIEYLNTPVSISVEIKDENDTIIDFSVYFDSGCSEESACNYNPYSVNDVDGACAYIDECGTCDNDAENDCIQDCFGAWGGTADYDLFGACCEGSSCIMDGCDLPDSTLYLTETSMAFNSSKAINEIKITLEGSIIPSSPLGGVASGGVASDSGFVWLGFSNSSNWVFGKDQTYGTSIPAGSCGNLVNIEYLNTPVSISVEIKDENDTVIDFSAYFDSGCSEESACNYNPYSVNDVDGACVYMDECGGNELDIINQGLIPETYNIYNIYPNPFNPVTNIEFGLPENTFVQIIVYDIKGRQITTLMNSFQFAGYYSLTWDASDSPSGVYFINMTSDGFKQTRQVVLMK